MWDLYDPPVSLSAGLYLLLDTSYLRHSEGVLETLLDPLESAQETSLS